jgi:hypothetical protein
VDIVVPPPVFGTFNAASGPYPSGAAPATKTLIETSVILEGISQAQFDATAKKSFKKVVAAGLGNQCAGELPDKPASCTVDDIKILEIMNSRRAGGARVTFDVDVAPGFTPLATSDLNYFLTNEATKKLQEDNGNLGAVQSTQVISAPIAVSDKGSSASSDATADTDSDQDTSSLIWIIAGSAGACVIIAGLAFAYHRWSSARASGTGSGNGNGHNLKSSQWEDLEEEEPEVEEPEVEVDLPPTPAVGTYPSRS